MIPQPNAPVRLEVDAVARGLLSGVHPRGEDGRRRVDVGLVPWFSDERPLQGLAGYLDWRTSGMLSRLIRQGLCRGDRGEAVLVPGRRTLPMRRLVMLGLGPQAEFDPDAGPAIARRMVSVAADLHPEDALFAMPGRLQERVAVESVFAGLTEALGGGPDRGAWTVPCWVVADPRHVPRLHRLLEGPPRPAKG